MKLSINFLIFVSISLTCAEDLSQGSEGTNLELAKGYTFHSQIDGGGKPAGSVYAYLGGKLSQVQPHPYSMDAGSTSIIPSATSALLSQLSTAVYFVAGALAAISLWYIISFIALPSSSSSSKKVSFVDDEDDDEVEEDNKVADSGSSGSKDSDKAKSRRRRSARKTDDEMTRLATIVLNAVQSGECLQQSICLLGKQMSEKKGRLADSLLSTLLPASVQQSDYYIILKRSLRAELNCDKYHCLH